MLELDELGELDDESLELDAFSEPADDDSDLELLVESRLSVR